MRALTGGAGVRYAIDAVGGATGTEVVKALGPGGRMLVYGTLSGEPITLDPRTLMDGQKRVEGFWLSVWARSRGPIKMLLLFRQIGKLLREGDLASEVAATFPLERVTEAVQAAAAPGKRGKVLLRIGTR